MPVPYSSAIIPATADEVWALVRDFNGMPAWHPAVKQSELEKGTDGTTIGAARKLTLGDGGIVRENLVAMNDHDRRFTYEITESPFPVRRYVSTLRIAPITATGEAFGEWWADYDADGADEATLTDTFANAIYGAGLAALQKYFSK